MLLNEAESGVYVNLKLSSDSSDIFARHPEGFVNMTDVILRFLCSQSFSEAFHQSFLNLVLIEYCVYVEKSYFSWQQVQEVKRKHLICLNAIQRKHHLCIYAKLIFFSKMKSLFKALMLLITKDVIQFASIEKEN